MEQNRKPRDKPTHLWNLIFDPEELLVAHARHVEGAQGVDVHHSLEGVGGQRRGTATPVHRPQRPAGSTHSSTRGPGQVNLTLCGNMVFADVIKMR